VLAKFNGTSGFTMAEVVFASAILFVVAVGSVGAFEYVGTSAVVAKEKVAALNLANQKLEEARNLPYDDVGIVRENGTFGDPAGTIPESEAVDEFTVTTAVSWQVDEDSGRSTYKNIRITVSWDEPRHGEVVVSTAVFGKSYLTNIGDLKIAVQERDTGEPIHGAQVRVTPNGSGTRVLWTNTDGEVFFGAVPIGTAGLEVEATDWVFDPLELPSLDIVADLLDSVVVYGVQPCSSVVTVLDTSSTPIPNAVVTITDSHGREQGLSTNTDGEAFFQGLYPDSYTVDVTASGRAPAVGALGPMLSGGEYPLTLTMTPVVPPGSARVRVRDGSGVLLSGASVSLRGPSPASTIVPGSPMVTASSGEALFADVLSGTYTATVSKTGYSTSVGSGAVVQPWETVIDVVLQVDASPGILHVIIDSSSRERFVVTGPNNYNSGTLRTSGGGHDYTLNGLTPGQYTVTPRRFAAKTVYVSSGSTTEVQW
jgi:type II secretory pathway pseudopilin PulG